MNAHTSATVVGLLVVLAFSPSAWAECAWVLWNEYSERGRADEPQRPLLAYQTKDECEKGIDGREQAALLFGEILEAMRRAFVVGIAAVMLGCSSTDTTPSANVTTLTPDAPQWFRVSVESVPERDRVRLQGYVHNLYGEHAGRVQLLAQAFDASGTIVDQKVVSLPYPVPAFDRVYYDIPNMPRADRYGVTVWYYERRKFW